MPVQVSGTCTLSRGSLLWQVTLTLGLGTAGLSSGSRRGTPLKFQPLGPNDVHGASCCFAAAKLKRVEDRGDIEAVREQKRKMYLHIGHIQL